MDLERNFTRISIPHFQANCLPDSHSMHITVSTGQQNTWADFLAVTLPRALELASEEHVELRRSVPRDVLDYMGVINSDSTDPR
jgi:lysine-specific demethylase/histidyl-hydroxylase NO66